MTSGISSATTSQITLLDNAQRLADKKDKRLVIQQQTVEALLAENEALRGNLAAQSADLARLRASEAALLRALEVERTRSQALSNQVQELRQTQNLQERKVQHLQDMEAMLQVLDARTWPDMTAQTLSYGYLLLPYEIQEQIEYQIETFGDARRGGRGVPPVPVFLQPIINKLRGGAGR